MSVFSPQLHHLVYFTVTNHVSKALAFSFFIFLLNLHFFTHYGNCPFSLLQLFSGLSLVLCLCGIFAI